MNSENSAHSTHFACWHSHLAQAIYIFVVVNFDALAQTSDIRIERRQVVFLNIHIYTCINTYIHACMHTYIHTCIHIYIHTCMHAYIHTYIHSSIHTYIHTYLLLISMLWHRQAIYKSTGDELCSSADCRI